MLSTRAKQYISTLQRERSENNPTSIIALLEKQNIPVFQPIVDFQCEYGGYIQYYGHNMFIWGIVHHKSHRRSFFKSNKNNNFIPDEIDHFIENEKDFFTCAKSHRSDHWTLDSQGALYWCGHFKASSFEKKMERDAFGEYLSTLGKWNRIHFKEPNILAIQTIASLMKNEMVLDATDEHQAIYFKDNLYVAIDFDNEKIIAHVIGDKTPEILKNINLQYSQ